MADNKKSILLYVDLIHTVRKMKKEDAGELFLHILKYVNDENPTTKNMIVELTFEPIKQQLKRDLIKYNNIVERNRINGAKPKKASRLLGKPKAAKKADSDSDKDSDIKINFEDFWNLYNKKQGDKVACNTKWDKLKNEERVKIIATLPKFIKSISDKKYQPLPATYLNQKRWNDEIEETQKYTPSTPGILD